MDTKNPTPDQTSNHKSKETFQVEKVIISHKYTH